MKAEINKETGALAGWYHSNKNDLVSHVVLFKNK